MPKRKTIFNRKIDRAIFERKVAYQKAVLRRVMPEPKVIELPDWFICKYGLEPRPGLTALFYDQIDVIEVRGWNGQLAYFTNILLSANRSEPVFRNKEHAKINWSYLLTQVLKPMYDSGEYPEGVNWRTTQYAKDMAKEASLEMREQRRQLKLAAMARQETWQQHFESLDKREAVKEAVKIIKNAESHPSCPLATECAHQLNLWILNN